MENKKSLIPLIIALLLIAPLVVTMSYIGVDIISLYNIPLSITKRQVVGIFWVLDVIVIYSKLFYSSREKERNEQDNWNYIKYILKIVASTVTCWVFAYVTYYILFFLGW